MIKLVTDSTCDMPPDWLAQQRITVVPVNIQFGLETFQEGKTITPETFYKRIQAEGVLPTTSQPAVGAFSEVYRQLAADGSDILSIHLTGKLSGTHRAATLAAQQVTGQCNVTVLDSHTGSVGLGLMLREAVALVDAGWSLAQITAHLKKQRETVNVFILLKDLRYAYLSGRVGRIQESLAALLNVKPIIKVENGALAVADRVRGQKRGLNRLVELAHTAAGDQPVHLAVAHAIAPDTAAELLAQAQQQLTVHDSFVTDVALSIAVHLGPGAVGLATYPAG